MPVAATLNVTLVPATTVCVCGCTAMWIGCWSVHQFQLGDGVDCGSWKSSSVCRDTYVSDSEPGGFSSPLKPLCPIGSFFTRKPARLPTPHFQWVGDFRLGICDFRFGAGHGRIRIRRQLPAAKWSGKLHSAPRYGNDRPAFHAARKQLFSLRSAQDGQVRVRPDLLPGGVAARPAGTGRASGICGPPSTSTRCWSTKTRNSPPSHRH